MASGRLYESEVLLVAIVFCPKVILLGLDDSEVFSLCLFVPFGGYPGLPESYSASAFVFALAAWHLPLCESLQGPRCPVEALVDLFCAQEILKLLQSGEAAVVEDLGGHVDPLEK